MGSLAAPKGYFKGCLHIDWAQIHPGIVFWGGKLNNLAVGLGGSMNNIIGSSVTPSVEKGISHTPELTARIMNALQLRLHIEPPHPPNYVTQVELDRRFFVSMEYWSEMLGERAVRKFEFVAKTLTTETRKENAILLGTPLYVAIAT